MSQRILFLCTGNYYRSRFAEILFNHLAQEHNLDWRADSRGIIAQSFQQPTPISRYTLDGLASRNITHPDPREPLQLLDTDLQGVDRIIALYEREHRPLLAQHFPNHGAPIEFWDVPDLDEMESEQALERIQTLIHALIDQLKLKEPAADAANVKQ